MSELNRNENRLAELKKLGELKEAGLLSDEEFGAEKNRILHATSEAINIQPVDSDRYQAGSHKTKSQPEWAKFDKNLLTPRAKRAWKFYLAGVLPLVVLAGFYPAKTVALLFCLWLLEIIFTIVSKMTGKRIGFKPVLRSWLLEKKEQ